MQDKYPTVNEELTQIVESIHNHVKLFKIGQIEFGVEDAGVVCNQVECWIEL